MEDLNTAIDIAVEAGGVVLSYFGTDRVDARAKGDRDVVTAADTASETLILTRLREAFPGDGVVAEEGGKEAARGRRRWYVDPLDGTLNYSRGLPVWCVSLALFDGDQPVLGVVHDPIRGETFSAEAGSGARLNGDPITTSGTTRLEDAFVHLTIDFHEASLAAGLEDMEQLAPRVLRTRNIGSAALALAYVAAGRLDGMVHRFANAWDYGAGVLLVREAGGAITEVAGAPYTVNSLAVLAAATEQLHGGLAGLLPASRSGRVE